MSIATLSINNPPPVVRLSTVAELLKRRTCQVMQDVDNGRLEFAFNVSAPKARNQEIRVLTESFRAYLAGTPCPVHNLNAAIAAIFPLQSMAAAAKATVTGSELQKRLVVSHNLIADLVNEGELKLAGGKPGRNKTPRLTFESVRSWLHRRCLGVAAYAQPNGKPSATALQPARKGAKS